MRIFLPVAVALFVSACSVSIPEGITPVSSFKLDAYLGTWYEIARLDHSFERGLEKVSAGYSLREDGGVRVLNRGFDTEKNAWNEAEGKGYFVGAAATGHLKVSFFGPFYGSYVIFELDPNYQYAFIAGDTKDYLWFLSRTPTVSPPLRERFIAQAKSLGFDTDALIWVKQ